MVFCVCKAERFVAIQLWFPLPPWLPKVTIKWPQQNAPTGRFSALMAPFSPGPFAHLPWPCQLDDSTRRETAPIHDSLHHMLTADTASLWVAVVSQDAAYSEHEAS